MPTKKTTPKAAAKAAPITPAKPAKAPAAKPAAKPAAPAPKKKPAPRAAGERMTAKDVMRVLEASGSEQARKTYARHGAKGPMFGVRFGDLFTLMKKIDVDHALARDLWATGNVDARNLAMKIADPAAMTADELDRWAVENEMGICDLYIASLAVESPHARTLLDRWLSAPDERRRAIGWTLLGRLSDRDESFPDADLLRYVERIEKGLKSAPNLERAEMNKALIALGGRNAAFRKAATAAAKRIGKVDVDHGDTACATPDAVPAIDKAWERAGKKFPSPAAAERSRESMRRRC